MVNRPFTRACGGALLVGLLFVSLGCGPNYKARGTVKGKVTIGTKHLTAGTVVFYGKEGGMTGTARIDKDGNYVMPDAPLGEVRITVTVPDLPSGTIAGVPVKMPGTKGKKDAKKLDKKLDKKEAKSVDPNDPSRFIPIMGEIPAEIVPIPDRYARVETSGLTFTVKSGEQTYDIPLTP
jgi:hypothetical protein